MMTTNQAGNSNNGQATNYDSPAQLSAICETMQTVENVRAQDRAMIDILMNGKRPYTDEEVKKHQIRINVNWNEGTNILTDANRQVNNATLYVGRFFTAKYLEGPQEKREEVGQKFTTIINRKLKKKKLGRRHMYVRKTRNASICLHGIGPLMWMTSSDWLPRYIPLEDLLIPTDTATSFDDLQQFAVNLYMTQGEFFDLYHGPDKGWNTKMCDQILDALKVPNSGNTFDLAQEPEKWQEQFKQNRCFYNSDKVSRVRLRMFLFQDPKDKKWYRRVILRENPGAKMVSDWNQKFVYTSDRAFADDIDQILHVQYGDCSIVPPLKYHSVRGLGTLLYAPIETSNRLTNTKIQAAFDNAQQLLRIQNPTDRARQQIVQLSPYSVVEDGVTFVKNDERHVPDYRLIESAQAGVRQNMSENSSSFKPDLNDGTSKEMTAFETNARVSSSQEMVGGMLQSVYSQDEPYFEEMVRRGCMKNPTDDDIKDFQRECIKAGIPRECLNADHWEIDIEKVIGAGDQVIAEKKSSLLLSQSQRFDPSSQRRILHTWTATVTDNPDLANELVPMKPPEATEGVLAGESAFGTLMSGGAVSPREGIDQQGYIESLISNMAGVIGKLEQQEQSGVQPELETLEGLDAVQQEINRAIEIFAQNEENKQLVREYMDVLGQLNNMLKKFIQHYQEANADTSGIDKEAQAKANSTMMLAQVKAQINQQSAQQKLANNQAKFEQKIRQDMEKHIQKSQEATQSHILALKQQMTQMQADLIDQAATTKADIAAKKAMATMPSVGAEE